MVSSFHTSQREEKHDHPLKAISRLTRLTQHWIIIPGMLQIAEALLLPGGISVLLLVP